MRLLPRGPHRPAPPLAARLPTPGRRMDRRRTGPAFAVAATAAAALAAAATAAAATAAAADAASLPGRRVAKSGSSGRVVLLAAFAFPVLLVLGVQDRQ